MPNQNQLKKKFIWLKATQELEAASHIHSQEEKEMNTRMQALYLAPSLHLNGQHLNLGSAAPAVGGSRPPHLVHSGQSLITHNAT